jgi:hypothetical protein
MRIIKLALLAAAAAPLLAGCGLGGGHNTADSNGSANAIEEEATDNGNIDDATSNNVSVDSGGDETRTAPRPTLPPKMPRGDRDEQSSSGVVLKPGAPKS